MLRVGLTGGIACGKTQVVRRLQAAGLATLDLDQVAHDLMEPGQPAFEEVLQAFGERVRGADGRLDRKALGALVFADESARDLLNAIVHPLVRARESALVREHARRGDDLLVTDGALLVEAGMHLSYDRLVAVHCSPETQLERLRKRDGIGEDDARRRMAAQMPLVEKMAFAHLRLSTEGPLAETQARADELARELRALVAARGAAGAAFDEPRVVLCLQLGPQRGPRGLDPARLIAEIAPPGRIDLKAVAQLLVPPATQPWYRAARPGDGRLPICLAGVIAAFALLRAPGDEAYAIGAMTTVARLTHTDSDAIGNAGAFVLATLAAWSRPAPRPPELLQASARWLAMARPCAGGDFPDRLTGVLQSVAAAGGRVGPVQEACLREFGEPNLAGTLLGPGAGSGGPSEEWRQAYLRLNAGVSSLPERG